MDGLSYLLGGGFLKGYRTYLLMALSVVGIGFGYVDGDMNLVQAITALSAALGLGAAANHSNPDDSKVVVVPVVPPVGPVAV